MISVKEILEKAQSVGLAEAVVYLADLAECQNTNSGSLRNVVTRLQAEEKRHRRNGAKGADNYIKFLDQPFPFPAKNNTDRS